VVDADINTQRSPGYPERTLGQIRNRSRSGASGETVNQYFQQWLCEYRRDGVDYENKKQE